MTATRAAASNILIGADYKGPGGAAIRVCVEPHEPSQRIVKPTASATLLSRIEQFRPESRHPLISELRKKH
jgi:hypothetical protein